MGYIKRNECSGVVSTITVTDLNKIVLETSCEFDAGSVEIEIK